jgi:hypothetical protein
VRKAIIAHFCSKIWPQKYSERYHQSGLSVSFMHFSVQVSLIVILSELAWEGVLHRSERFLHEVWSYLNSRTHASYSIHRSSSGTLYCLPDLYRVVRAT